MSGAAGGGDYRPDIEGLRALAVCLVVACHAGVPGLAGGFIGVDVFFVLSGFLITRLLVAEHRRSGGIDWARFYARRFRRLLPALLLMLAVTALAALLLLPPHLQGDHAVAAASAALWLSNLHFLTAAVDYFGQAAAGNPFLHTWSLGVEEQFYLVWPLVVAGLMAAGRGRPAAGFALLLALSLSACLLILPANPAAAFYLMPTRAWQFAAGALVCLAVARPGDGRWAGAAGVAGLGLILVGVVVLDEHQPYPGLAALLPTLGTALVLWAGNVAPHGVVSRLLAIPPAQGLGRLSYGWYLWHWPVLVIGGSFLGAGRLLPNLALVLFALVLAAGSHRLVEAPLRRQDWFLRPPQRGLLAAAVAMTVAVTLSLHWQGQAVGLAHGRHDAGRAVAVVEAPVIYAMGCDDWFHNDRLKTCEFGSVSAPRTAVVLGDSIGLQWFPALAEVLTAPDWRLVVLTKSACPIADVELFYPRIGRNYSECTRWRAAALDWIAAQRPDLLVIGSSHTYAMDEKAWQAATARVLDRVVPAVGQVRLLRATPRLPFDPRGCIARQGLLLEWLATGRDCTAPPLDEAENARVHEALRAASATYPTVTVVDLNAEVCPGGLCRALQDGYLAFRDEQHLNGSFARRLAPALAAALDIGLADPAPGAPLH